jgi:hypothetical protein
VRGPVSPATFDAILKALVARRPDIRGAVQRLELLMSPEPSIDSHREEVLGQERDSVGLALEMSGLPSRTLPSIHDVPQRMRFLSTLGQAIVREDPAIQHDASVFGDWNQLARYQVGAVMFEDRGERVTVINVNRHPVERSLGVDLIYYTHRFDAYVLIQYKSLRREGSEWVYRPDEQLKKELARMRAIPVEAWSGRPDDFRLTAEACYIKVCKSLLSTPLAEGLIPGWYLPVSYWDALSSFGKLSGPKGGIVLTANTVGRYLNNEQFVGMIARGWLGSRGDASRWIDEVIRLGLEEGKSIILAAHSRTRGTT